MESWSGEQRAFAVKSYYKNNDSYAAARRDFIKNFNLEQHERVPSAYAIKTWVNNFEETGSALKKKPPGGKRTVRTSENVAALRDAVDKNPSLSLARHAVAMNMSKTSVRRILRQDLHCLRVQEPMETAEFSEEPSDLDSEEENSRQHPEDSVRIKEEPAVMTPEERCDDAEKLNDSALIGFEENLIVKLKQLSKLEAVKLMLEIQELVTQTRLKHLQTLEEDRLHYDHV